MPSKPSIIPPSDDEIPAYRDPDPPAAESVDRGRFTFHNPGAVDKLLDVDYIHARSDDWDGMPEHDDRDWSSTSLGSGYVLALRVVG